MSEAVAGGFGQLLHTAATACGGVEVEFVVGSALRAIVSPRRDSAVAAVDATFEVAGRTMRLRVGLPRTFPRAPPDVYLLRPRPTQLLAHCEKKTGWVCFAAREGMAISNRRLDAVVKEAISLAISTLAAASEGSSSDEVLRELGSYWQQSADYAARSFVAADGRVRTVEYTLTAGRVDIIADDVNEARDYFPVAAGGTVRTAVYVPLAGSVKDDHIDPNEFTSPARLRALLADHVADDSRRELARALKRRSPRLFLLGFPRGDGRRTLVALRCFPRDGADPLHSARSNELIAVERYDIGYVRERGGALQELEHAHVLVLGCGSVGGHLAVALAHAGVRHLTLADPDVMSVDNTFRHVLGRTCHGENKAAALANEVRRRVPGVRVEAFELPASDVLDGKHVDVRAVSAVVVAIGDPSESRYLNEALLAADLPVVFAWLEPLGLGGHALATRPRTSGCYECLYSEPDGGERLGARSDFSASGQQFTRDVSGCDSVFTPYGDLDARRSAELAARSCVELLARADSPSTLMSWKGDPTAFTAAGFTTSARWNMSQDQLVESRNAFSSPGCPVCGKTAG